MTIANDIEEQAGGWINRLEAAGVAAVGGELDSWLAADPRHRAAFLRLSAAWSRADRLRRLRPLDGRVDIDLLSPSSGPQKTARRPRRAHGRAHGILAAGLRTFVAQPGRVLRVAAAMALVALIGAVSWKLLPGLSSQEYVTDIGGSRHLELPDGSTVDLNTDSRVAVRYTATAREITLERGEAFFKVAHDAQRPFEVRADGMLARALGTQFSMHLQDRDLVEVLVVEGRVRISKWSWLGSKREEFTAAGAALPVLVAGDRALVTPQTAGARNIGMSEVSRQLAWVSGKVSFLGETLSEAVDEFNRYNVRRLVIADPNIGDMQVSGSFLATDPMSFVSAITQMSGVRAMGLDDKLRREDIRLMGEAYIESQ